MPFTDLPLSELRAYRPAVRRPSDFVDFWRTTTERSRDLAADVAPRLDAADTPITEIIVENLTFAGFDGEPVNAWVSRPRRDDSRPLPAVVEFLGYEGGRGLPGERSSWALAGFVHIVMDTRGQGSGWGTGGDTPDRHGSSPQTAGWMTAGVLDPADHFYRRVFSDALRLVETTKGLGFVDADRVSVTGTSQGGGIAIAAGALAEMFSDGVLAVLPDVAFLADWEHGAECAVGGPYLELVRYLAVHRDHAETVWQTSGYFDVVNFAAHVTAPALFSVALMDDVVPPRTTFAAFNALSSRVSSIEVYPYNGHEGGLARHWEKQVAFVRDLLPTP